jgi:hypothetical protein
MRSIDKHIKEKKIHASKVTLMNSPGTELGFNIC